MNNSTALALLPLSKVTEDPESMAAVEALEALRLLALGSSRGLLPPSNQLQLLLHKVPLLLSAVRAYQGSYRNDDAGGAADTAGVAGATELPKVRLPTLDVETSSPAPPQLPLIGALKLPINSQFAVAGLNMLIELRRKIRFVLHVLKLANAQISNRVRDLQQLFDDKRPGTIHEGEQYDGAVAPSENEDAEPDAEPAAELAAEPTPGSRDAGMRHRTPHHLRRSSVSELDANLLTPQILHDDADMSTPGPNLRAGLLLPTILHALFITARTLGPAPNATLQTQREIILTVKKIVLVVLLYAGLAPLPDPDRAEIRENLIRLPLRWLLLLVRRQLLLHLEDAPAMPSDAEEAAQQKKDRVLVLANELLEMISNITRVFDLALTGAEAYVKQGQYEKVYRKRAIIQHEREMRAKRMRAEGQEVPEDDEDEDDDYEIFRAC